MEDNTYILRSESKNKSNLWLIIILFSLLIIIAGQVGYLYFLNKNNNGGFFVENTRKPGNITDGLMEDTQNPNNFRLQGIIASVDLKNESMSIKFDGGIRQAQADTTVKYFILDPKNRKTELWGNGDLKEVKIGDNVLLFGYLEKEKLIFNEFILER